jgi:hypothetical protein
VVGACVEVFYRFLVSSAPLDGTFVDGLVGAVVRLRTLTPHSRA